MAPRVLIVAGRDSASFSGIDADLRVLEHMGLEASVVQTAQTSQGARNFDSAEGSSKEQFEKDLAKALSGQPKVIKTGMLHRSELVESLADSLEFLSVEDRPALIIDPVISSTSGGVLLDNAGVKSLLRRLLPLAECITPNIPELKILAGEQGKSGDLISAGCAWVYLKGGHAQGEICVDHLISSEQEFTFKSDRLPGGPFRGSGCTLASALAGGLAQGLDIVKAAEQAHRITALGFQQAIARDGAYQLSWDSKV